MSGGSTEENERGEQRTPNGIVGRYRERHVGEQWRRGNRGRGCHCLHHNGFERGAAGFIYGSGFNMQILVGGIQYVGPGGMLSAAHIVGGNVVVLSGGSARGSLISSGGALTA